MCEGSTTKLPFFHLFGLFQQGTIMSILLDLGQVVEYTLVLIWGTGCLYSRSIHSIAEKGSSRKPVGSGDGKGPEYSCPGPFLCVRTLSITAYRSVPTRPLYLRAK